MGQSTGAVREPVSLRLPSGVAARVEAYANRQGLRKTDAYLHFIELGLGVEEDEGASSRFARLESRLDEMFELLRGHEGARLDTQAVCQGVARAAAEFPAIREAYIFGSFARGTAGPGSDVDVRVVLDRKEAFGLNGLSRFAKRVEQETGRVCDVVSAEVIKNEALAQAIERDKVLAYEREE